MRSLLENNLMRRAGIIFAAFLLFLSSAFAQDFPERAGTLVTDFTNTLKADEKAALEQKLVAFDDSTSTQIAVVIMQSTGAYDINQYAQQLAEKWGIGRKEKDNGLILLIAKEDRKMSIQVGYGLEGAVTDAMTKRVIEQVLKPAFKQGDFFGGIDEATTVLMAMASGEFKAEASDRKKKKDQVPWGILPIILLIIVVLMLRRGRTIGRYARTNNLGFWAALALMNSMSNRSSGSWGSFHSGSGGFGGGGFGGFGGGSFGGGGSSGSW